MSLVHERLAQVVKAVSNITKQSSPGVNYQFRSIDAVMDHLHDRFAEAELTLSARVRDDWQVNMIPGSNNRVQAQALFRVDLYAMATDGTEALLGTGMAQSHDYGDKAVYQAQQNAIKYLLLTAFSIPIAEPDMDARHADDVPSRAMADLEAVIAEAEAAGVKGDWAKTRDYGAKSATHAVKATEKVRAEIANNSPADGEGEASPAGDQPAEVGA